MLIRPFKGMSNLPLSPRLQSRTVCILCKETHDRVIRIAPPLTITSEEIDWAFDRIRKGIEKR